MKKYWINFIFVLVVVFLLAISPTFVNPNPGAIFQDNYEIITQLLSQNRAAIATNLIAQNSNNSENNQNSAAGFPVMLEDEVLFNFKEPIANISPQIRAERATKEINRFAENYSLPYDQIQVNQLTPELVLISVEDLPLVTLISADAKLANTSLTNLAQEYQQKIQTSVKQYREERNIKRIISQVLLGILITLIFGLLVRLCQRISPLITYKIKTLQEGLIREIKIQNLPILSIKQQKRFLIILNQVIFLAIILVLFATYLGLLFNLFPQTESYGDIVFSAFQSAISQAGSSLLSYLPNLFTIAITIFLSYYTTRFSQVFFNALKDGSLTITGFYPEWAEPTYRITVFLIYALALAIIFPYLPGSDSPAFRGVSLFLGALFTFGGASAISNFVGGIIVIYTRAYQIGDLVKVGEVTGSVLEKTILSTRIRTPNNQIVTIPNASIVANNIINYTATNRELKQPLILNTTITLGYDNPWRKVHEVLVEAALATNHISKEFRPFVLQTSLNDFYVSYELKAYTELALSPIEIPRIYSELHQNIQDKCNEAGIEIMSPHYTALRDGNQNTIPANYLPEDYQAPGFKIDS
jgi:small-conductance mechanosensitive channel